MTNTDIYVCDGCGHIGDDLVYDEDIKSDVCIICGLKRKKKIESFMMNGKEITIVPIQDFQTIFAEEGCFYVDLVHMFDLKGGHHDEH